MILPETSADSATVVAVGIAGYTPGDEMQPSDLLQHADCALYRAKAGGRNRVVVFGND